MNRKMQKHKKMRFARRSRKEVRCRVISKIQDQYENKCRMLLYAATEYCCTQLQNIAVRSYRILLYAATEYCCTQLQNIAVRSYRMLLYAATECCCTQLQNIAVRSYRILLYAATEYSKRTVNNCNQCCEGAALPCL